MKARRDDFEDEDRLLHVWTPRILRGALAASMVLLVAGLCLIGVSAPGSYVARFHALKHGVRRPQPEGPFALLGDALHGHGRALLVIGLLVLTLVPIGRVAFCMLVFVRGRDWIFSVLTAVVLGLLCAGILLGRMG